MKDPSGNSFDVKPSSETLLVQTFQKVALCCVTSDKFICVLLIPLTLLQGLCCVIQAACVL